MEAFKLMLEFLKVLATPPGVLCVVLLKFGKPIRSLAEGLRSALDRVRKVQAWGICLEFGLAKQLDTPADINFSASEGTYSNDNRAVFS